MRRRLIGGGVVLALVVAGGAAAWLWVQSSAEREVDARLDALAARTGLTWREREITGLPFSANVRLTDVEAADPRGAWAVSLPWIEATVEPDDLDRAVLTASPEGEVRLSPPGLPPLDLHLSHENLTAEIRSVEGRIETRLLADRVDLTAPEDAELRGGLHAEGVDLTHLGGAPGVHVLGGDVSRAALEWDAELPRRRVSRGDLRVEGARLQLRATGADAGGPGAFLAAPASAAEVTVEADAFGARAERRIAPEAAPWARSLEAADAAFRLALAEGRLAYAAETGAARATGRFPGAVSAERVSAAIETPTTPAEAPQPWLARVEVEGALPDDAFWAEVDPDGVLSREPVDLAVELDGEAEMTRPLGAPGPGAPLETRTVVVRRAEAEGLGATASATGRLETAAGPRGLEGVLSLRAEGVEPLIADLAEAGLLAPELRTVAETLLRVYARPAEDDPEALAAEIELRDGRVFANGQRLR